MSAPAEVFSPTTPVSARERHALWAALVLIIVWGANFSVQKAVFNVLSPGGFLFVRYLIMPVAAALLLCSRHRLQWPRLPRAELLALLKLGIAGHLLHVGLVTYGIHWSTPFSSSLILACGPVFTLLILRWHGIERLTLAQIVGVGIASVGVLVFLSDKLLGGAWRASGGDLVLLVAASLFSYYTVVAKPLIQRHGGVVVMTYATLLGSAPVVLVSLPAGLQVQWSAVSPLIWAGTFYSVLISAFLGWIVWGWVNAVRGVARSAPLMYLMPPVRSRRVGAHRRDLHRSEARWRRAGARWRRARAVRVDATRSGARSARARRLIESLGSRARRYCLRATTRPSEFTNTRYRLPSLHVAR